MWRPIAQVEKIFIKDGKVESISVLLVFIKIPLC